jgi:bacillithiol system protein YtxJ
MHPPRAEKNPTVVDILNWFRTSGDSEETTAFNFAEFIGKEVAVVFKHSQTCPVSWMAKRHVDEFLHAHPEVPLYTLIVQKERELSNQIASATGIRHESPQVLVFRKGQVVADASHGEVTAQYLATATAQ